jgi:hypothetical protein
MLRDANDDMVLEAAANAAATQLVTFNARDFGVAPARRAAKRDGVSLNQFINTALAEKVAAPEAEDVFTRRAARADRARFLEVLERLGGEPPRPGDEPDRKD